MNVVKAGIIGCGNISDAYLRSCPIFLILDVIACADIDISKAQERANEYDIRALTVEEILADPEIEIIINLTVPTAHTGVNLAALAAGKHIYTEKPLAVRREDGRRALDLAREKGLRLGCAPDTFLGGGLQTCRKLLDENALGRPVAFSAFMGSRGPERWHPNPANFYQPGAGPLFDMGPYYLTALVSLLGPVSRVCGVARISFAERLAEHPAIAGQRVPVTTPTHVAALLEMASGPIGTLTTSFDVPVHRQPRIEIYGSEGTLSLPDPNSFGGPVEVAQLGQREWQDVALTHGYRANHRGLGVADMAHALRSGRPHRASGELAFHVLEVMHAILEAAETGQRVEIGSTCPRPAALPAGLPEGVLDP